MYKLITFLLLVVITSCASYPDAEEIASADYGTYVSPSECKSIAEATIKFGLKDPSSAVFSHSSCSTGYWNSVPIMGLPIAFGYMQTGTVNAKNSFGGYVGAKGYSVLIRNGNVIRWCINNEDGLCIPNTY